MDWLYSLMLLSYIRVPRENQALCTGYTCRGESILWRAAEPTKYQEQEVVFIIKVVKLNDFTSGGPLYSQTYYDSQKFVNISRNVDINSQRETGWPGTRVSCHRKSSFLLGSSFDKIPYKQHGLILYPFNARPNVPNWSKTPEDTLDIVSLGGPGHLQRVRGPGAGAWVGEWPRLTWAGSHTRSRDAFNVILKQNLIPNYLMKSDVEGCVACDTGKAEW